jgi:SAM-dependent methyltransferase
MNRARSPFKDYGTVFADRYRYDLTLEKLPQALSGKALDLGEENPFTPLLKERYRNLEILNTPEGLDFDTDGLPFLDKAFDIIFSFEVIEHLMNPLWNLRECSRILRDEGIIYLTTPKGGFPSRLMWHEHHFHEMDRERLQVLFRAAGLSSHRFERFNKGAFYWWHMGIFRPTLRLLFGGWYYIELRKVKH